MSWARARHGTAGLTVPQARHGPSKLNRAVPGQESRHGVLARHGTRSRRAVPGHGGTVPCPGVPVPGRHGTPKWTCILDDAVQQGGTGTGPRSLTPCSLGPSSSKAWPALLHASNHQISWSHFTSLPPMMPCHHPAAVASDPGVVLGAWKHGQDGPAPLASGLPSSLAPYHATSTWELLVPLVRG